MYHCYIWYIEQRAISAENQPEEGGKSLFVYLAIMQIDQKARIIRVGLALGYAKSVEEKRPPTINTVKYAESVG